jgi:hypothetical protein
MQMGKGESADGRKFLLFDAAGSRSAQRFRHREDD